MQNCGHIRFSTCEQDENRQRIALVAIGVPAENAYLDKQSGKDFRRAAIKLCRVTCQSTARSMVKSIDHLERNYNEILQQWHMLTKEKEVNIVTLDMPLLNTRAANERANIHIRQAEGIAALPAACWMKAGTFYAKVKKYTPTKSAELKIVNPAFANAKICKIQKTIAKN